MLDKDNFKARAKQIHEKVNLLEKLHKTCQLAALGIEQPILNEMRYLARALTDVLFFQDAEEFEEFQKFCNSVHTAELAVHSAINDSVDTLITFVKSFLGKIDQNYPKFQIAVSGFGDAYIEALESIKIIDTLVVLSRGNRQERYDLYKSLADLENKVHLERIAAFALQLAQIEAIAQGHQFPRRVTDVSDVFLSTQMLDALNQTSTNQAQFTLDFQPKFKVVGDKRTIIGAEALLRFQVGATRFSPDQFISVAERTKLISPIGKWVMRSALNVLDTHPRLPRISVNVSALELLSHTYSSDVIEMLEASSVDASRLELEITESCALDDLDSVRHLHALSSKGIRIAIDDFGTGETRFDYLAAINIHVIKIDRKLVLDYEAAPREYTKLLKAIVAVGKGIELEVIVEGIEKEEHLQAFCDLGVEDFQGFLLGRPMSLDKFLELC
jgi:EAL domain-containing protein (putative c-di-GMP-specific phosphodiesterase class I)